MPNRAGLHISLNSNRQCLRERSSHGPEIPRLAIFREVHLRKVATRPNTLRVQGCQGLLNQPLSAEQIRARAKTASGFPFLSVSSVSSCLNPPQSFGLSMPSAFIRDAKVEAG